VNTLFRGLGLGVVLSFVLILSGCSTDNESEANKLQAGSGAVPKPAEGTSATVVKQPQSMEEFAKQREANNPYAKGGYPGAAPGAAPAKKQ
jgi:hypothetical protein